MRYINRRFTYLLTVLTSSEHSAVVVLVYTYRTLDIAFKIGRVLIFHAMDRTFAYVACYLCIVRSGLNPFHNSTLKVKTSNLQVASHNML